MLYIIFCRWLDSNRVPLELEATALPTEPQPVPNMDLVYLPFLVIQKLGYSSRKMKYSEKNTVKRGRLSMTNSTKDLILAKIQTKKCNL